MPTLKQLLTSEDLKRAAPVSTIDLSPYIEIIEEATKGEHLGAIVDLDAGESSRSAKRRFTMAAKVTGWNLTWRKSPDGELRFVLNAEGETPPGGRTRRKKSAV